MYSVLGSRKNCNDIMKNDSAILHTPEFNSVNELTGTSGDSQAFRPLSIRRLLMSILKAMEAC